MLSVHDDEGDTQREYAAPLPPLPCGALGSKAFSVSVLNETGPQLQQQVQSLAFVGKESEEPGGGVELRRHASARQDIADGRVVVLQEQPEQAEARLQADEVVVQKQRRHEDINEQGQGFEACRQRVLQELGLGQAGRAAVLLMVPGLLLALLQLAFEGQPEERAQYLVVALLVAGSALPGVKGEHFLDFVDDLLRGEVWVIHLEVLEEPFELANPRPVGICLDDPLVGEAQLGLHYFLIHQLRRHRLKDLHRVQGRALVPAVIRIARLLDLVKFGQEVGNRNMIRILNFLPRLHLFRQVLRQHFFIWLNFNIHLIILILRRLLDGALQVEQAMVEDLGRICILEALVSEAGSDGLILGTQPHFVDLVAAGEDGIAGLDADWACCSGALRDHAVVAESIVRGGDCDRPTLALADCPLVRQQAVRVVRGRCLHQVGRAHRAAGACRRILCEVAAASVRSARWPSGA